MATLASRISGSAYFEQHVVQRCLGGAPTAAPQLAPASRRHPTSGAGALDPSALVAPRSGAPAPEAPALPLWDADAPRAPTAAGAALQWPTCVSLTAIPTRRCIKCFERRLPGILVSPSPSIVKGRPFRKFDSAALLFPHCTAIASVERSGGALGDAADVTLAVNISLVNASPFALTLILPPHASFSVDSKCHSESSAVRGVLNFGSDFERPAVTSFPAGSAAAELLLRGAGHNFCVDAAGCVSCVVLSLHASDGEGRLLDAGAAGSAPSSADSSTAFRSPLLPFAEAAAAATGDGGAAGATPRVWAHLAWEPTPGVSLSIAVGPEATPTRGLRVHARLLLPASVAADLLPTRGQFRSALALRLAGLLLVPEDLVLERSGLGSLPPPAAASGAALSFELRVPVHWQVAAAAT